MWSNSSTDAARDRSRWRCGRPDRLQQINLARAHTRFVCQQCGAAYPKWAGRCEACGGWNNHGEDTTQSSSPRGLGGGKGKRIEVVGLAGTSAPLQRRITGIAELDRVCGGGLVPGSALLVGGDPGIGKSTLVLQAVAALSASQSGRPPATCLYISGEASLDQIRMRALRLEVAQTPVQLAAATGVRDIAASLDQRGGPDVVVVDSIQTLYLDNLDSAPGTVSQVRASAHELIRLAKERGFSLLLVGHVTKEGTIAGPRVLEHMVDTVLYFEGERGHQFRILRAVKNRFGPTDEIGVFEMTDRGLAEVPNPSALFLAERRGEVSGSAVFAGMEGTRPVLMEIQALVSPSPLAPRRKAPRASRSNRSRPLWTWSPGVPPRTGASGESPKDWNGRANLPIRCPFRARNEAIWVSSFSISSFSASC